MLDIYDCTGLRGTIHVSRVYNITKQFSWLKIYGSCDANSHDKHFDLGINTFRRMCTVHSIAVCVVS